MDRQAVGPGTYSCKLLPCYLWALCRPQTGVMGGGSLTEDLCSWEDFWYLAFIQIVHPFPFRLALHRCSQVSPPGARPLCWHGWDSHLLSTGLFLGTWIHSSLEFPLAFPSSLGLWPHYHGSIFLCNWGIQLIPLPLVIFLTSSSLIFNNWQF